MDSTSAASRNELTETLSEPTESSNESDGDVTTEEETEPPCDDDCSDDSDGNKAKSLEVVRPAPSPTYSPPSRKSPANNYDTGQLQRPRRKFFLFHDDDDSGDSNLTDHRPSQPHSSTSLRNTRTGLYDCKRCHRRYRRRSDLKSHMASHTSDACRCHVCSKHYVSVKGMLSHLRRKHAEFNVYKCPRCRTFTSVTAQDLRTHMAEVHKWNGIARLNYRSASSSTKNKKLSQGDGLANGSTRQKNDGTNVCRSTSRTVSTERHVWDTCHRGASHNCDTPHTGVVQVPTVVCRRCQRQFFIKRRLGQHFCVPKGVTNLSTRSPEVRIRTCSVTLTPFFVTPEATGSGDLPPPAESPGRGAAGAAATVHQKLPGDVNGNHHFPRPAANIPVPLARTASQPASHASIDAHPAPHSRKHCMNKDGSRFSGFKSVRPSPPNLMPGIASRIEFYLNKALDKLLQRKMVGKSCYRKRSKAGRFTRDFPPHINPC